MSFREFRYVLPFKGCAGSASGRDGRCFHLRGHIRVSTDTVQRMVRDYTLLPPPPAKLLPPKTEVLGFLEALLRRMRKRSQALTREIRANHSSTLPPPANDESFMVSAHHQESTNLGFRAKYFYVLLPLKTTILADRSGNSALRFCLIQTKMSRKTPHTRV